VTGYAKRVRWFTDVNNTRRNVYVHQLMHQLVNINIYIKIHGATIKILGEMLEHATCNDFFFLTK